MVIYIWSMYPCLLYIYLCQPKKSTFATSVDPPPELPRPDPPPPMAFPPWV